MDRGLLDNLKELLQERIRAGGAGIPAFFTPTGVGTQVAEGKETRVFNGRECVMELALTADIAIVKAWKGDTHGNLIYKATARNFNPMMATAGKITIAEVEELVPAGELDPDALHTRYICSANYSVLIMKNQLNNNNQKQVIAFYSLYTMCNFRFSIRS